MSAPTEAPGRLVVVGDALLDRDVEGRSERLCPDAPVPVLDEERSRLRPGGAALAATLAAAAGAPVTLVSALAPDPAGRELSRMLLGAGVDLVDLGLGGSTPEKIRLLDDGRPLLRLDRGGRPGPIAAGAARGALGAVLRDAAAVLVSDYGRGIAAAGEVREALRSRPPGLPLVWDPHPRGPAPLLGATLATPNASEARRSEGEAGRGREVRLAELGERLASRWRVGAVAITLGEGGALLARRGGAVRECPAEPAAGDPCGAGDRFAVEAASSLAAGAPVEAAVGTAVHAATEFVRAGGARGAAAPARRRPTATGGRRGGEPRMPFSIASARESAERVRGEGGTVVATGGCFDLLHLGHVSTLEAARALGDCLVVLLNSDRSVSRLKGADRPLIGELERAALLEALACVDAVAVFDEPTPVEALRILRPDVWAKGGDYEADELPESRALAAWGGRTAILPYLAGRSTTKLIEEVGTRAGG